eukprot:TRINITY_DN778_c0_g1_i18.p1 TRINITY_DN778_c0_g1~~TRINITY_DN778_c0_g1_i18.p1  ORF type:complete len:467 (-),score=8.77 TRINITY_DN778_c0_g1_i18:321-1721(-)
MRWGFLLIHYVLKNFSLYHKIIFPISQIFLQHIKELPSQMNKAVCQFKPLKGPKKGFICGNPCILIEGQEPRCAKHKESYLETKNEHRRQKYEEMGLYVTKNKLITESNEKCKQQENQIGMLSEDLSAAKAEIIALKLSKAEMESRIGVLSENLDKQNVQIEELCKTIEQMRNNILSNEKAIAELHGENEKLKQQLRIALQNNLSYEKTIGIKYKNIETELQIRIKNLEAEVKSKDWIAKETAVELEDVKHKFNILDSRWDNLIAVVDKTFAKLKEIEEQYGNMYETIEKMKKISYDKVKLLLIDHHKKLKFLMEKAKDEGLIEQNMLQKNLRYRENNFVIQGKIFQDIVDEKKPPSHGDVREIPFWDVREFFFQDWNSAPKTCAINWHLSNIDSHFLASLERSSEHSELRSEYTHHLLATHHSLANLLCKNRRYRKRGTAHCAIYLFWYPGFFHSWSNFLRGLGN